MKVFGEELRRLRRRAGLSQETLADRAGLSPEAVSLLERGRRSPRMTTMRLLAEALSLDEADRTALFSTVTQTPLAVPVLPVYADPLIGREREVEALGELVARPEARLVTLLGPSGVGKTRVAVAFAAATQVPDGVHWLPAGSVPDPASVLPALAGALGIRSSPTADLADILDHLRPQQTVLIIDNAEQQLAAISQVCAALLAGAELVKIVITSRHALGTAEERIFPVSPLALPSTTADVTEVRQAAASQLFLVRAAAAGVLTAADAAAVVRISHRLDGLPLALELAAARTNVLTVGELADTLDAELGFLHASGPDGDRQLADVMVEWSYALLNPAEQRLFARLAVFGASFARDAVTAVCADGLSEVEVVDMLSSLVSKTLVVRRDDGSPQARFRLLQLIGQYAAERLAEQPDAATTHRRHAEYYCRVAEESATELDNHDQSGGLVRLDRELANIRRAIGWSLGVEPELALRMVGALSRWCALRGRYSDGRRWATAALAANPEAMAALRTPVLAGAGLLAFLQCDYVEARTMITQAQHAYEAAGDQERVAWATARLGAIARELGDYDNAAALHHRALRTAEEIGDDHQVAAQINNLSFLSWLRGRLDEAVELGQEALARMRRIGDQEGVIWSLINLGAAARYRGDLDAAELLLTQCLDLGEEMSFREGNAWALNQLGALARQQGRPDRAQPRLEASLAEHRELGDRWRAASVHDELAAVAVATGRPREAARELGRADRLRSEIDAPVPAVERSDRLATVAATRSALGSAFEAATLVD